jgi:hypothetical protein
MTKYSRLVSDIYIYEINDANKHFADDKDPRWHRSWFPLMKKISLENELSNIILIVQYKNGRMVDYWVTSLINDDIYKKNNLDVIDNKIIRTNRPRGSDFNGDELKKLCEDGFISQKYINHSKFEEQNFLFKTCEEFRQFFNLFTQLL